MIGIFKNCIVLFVICWSAYASAQTNDFLDEEDCPERDVINDTLAIDFSDIKPCCIYSGIRFDNRQFLHQPQFESSQFIDDANFNGVTFHKGAKFTKSHFHGDANFISSKANSPLVFYSAVFFSNVIFDKVDVNAFSTFINVRIQGKAKFDSVRFSSGINFLMSVFNDSFSMNKSIVDSTIYFSSAVFEKGASFEAANFPGKTYFDGATLDGDVIFRNTKFGEILSFSGAKIRSKIDFDGTLMADTLILTNLKNFAEIMDFSKVEVQNNRPVHIEITGADMEKLKFDYKRCSLYFDEQDTDIKISDSAKAATYISLMENQRLFGFDEGYKLASKEYKEWTYLSQGKVLINWIQKYFFNYGYDIFTIWLRNTFFLSIGVLVIYILVNARIKRRGTRRQSTLT